MRKKLSNRLKLKKKKKKSKTINLHNTINSCIKYWYISMREITFVVNMNSNVDYLCNNSKTEGKCREKGEETLHMENLSNKKAKIFLPF